MGFIIYKSFLILFTKIDQIENYLLERTTFEKIRLRGRHVHVMGNSGKAYPRESVFSCVREKRFHVRAFSQK